MNVMVKTQPFSLPPLPYDEGALEPTISKRTMGFHYGKHHATYVKKLNELVAGTPFADQKLDDIVKTTYLDATKTKIFNNAAQAWNHTFFWACLSPNGGTPKGQLAAALERDLGSYEKFKKAFVKAGTEHFASGWVWLVSDKGKLSIETGHDAVTPLAQGKTLHPHHRPLGACLLSRLPEQPGGVSQAGERQAPQLGLCPAELRARRLTAGGFSAPRH